MNVPATAIAVPTIRLIGTSWSGLSGLRRDGPHAIHESPRPRGILAPQADGLLTPWAALFPAAFKDAICSNSSSVWGRYRRPQTGRGFFAQFARAAAPDRGGPQRWDKPKKFLGIQ